MRRLQLPYGTSHSGFVLFSMTFLRNQVQFLKQRACVISVCAKSLSRVWLFATLWTVARQSPLSMGFSRWNTGVGWHFLHLPNPRIKPASLTSLAWAGGFFTASATWKRTWSVCIYIYTHTSLCVLSKPLTSLDLSLLQSLKKKKGLWIPLHWWLWILMGFCKVASLYMTCYCPLGSEWSATRCRFRVSGLFLH